MFAILRHSKITSQQQLTVAAAHNARDMFVPNAIPGDPPVVLAGTADPGRDLRDLLARKEVARPRKGAVIGIEIVLTASPEFFERGDDAARAARLADWSADQLRYLRDRYGADNVVNALLHLDEKTPHIHAIVAPLVYKADRREKGANAGRLAWRLTAHDVIGGNRSRLADEQTRYADAMAHHGLRRGIPSNTVHLSAADWQELQVAAADRIDARTAELDAREAALAAAETKIAAMQRHYAHALERLSQWFLNWAETPSPARVARTNDGTAPPDADKIAIALAAVVPPPRTHLERGRHLARLMGLTRK